MKAKPRNNDVMKNGVYQPKELTNPPVRQGAQDALKIPSIINGSYHHRDGRKEKLK